MTTDTIASLRARAERAEAALSEYRKDLETHAATSVGELYTRLRAGQDAESRRADAAEADARVANNLREAAEKTWSDWQRAAERAEADAAAMRSVLTDEVRPFYAAGGYAEIELIDAALSSTAGAALLERLEKAKARVAALEASLQRCESLLETDISERGDRLIAIIDSALNGPRAKEYAALCDRAEKECPK